MNIDILNTNIQEFIDSHLSDDISKLLLKGTSFNTVTTKDIVNQIEAKNKSKKKLPTWFATKGIYYPNKLNIEQTSSEIAAKYKSKLLEGKSILDLTGGFGVDAYYFSKTFPTVVHCEINKELSEIVTHNNVVLGISNIKTHVGDGIDFLINNKNRYDWIYIDPSRRHDSKGKVFFLKDCMPNVPKYLDVLFKSSSKIAIKTSPLLDLSVGINELAFVKAIHIVAINNEVKELLWLIENGFNSAIAVETVNIIGDQKEVFSFTLAEESKVPITFDHPSEYLYEPNAAILKSGGFNSLAKHLALSKLHQHSHLYTSDALIAFPGRAFKIENIISYNKKNIKSLKLTNANISTRNFPENVAQIRKKFNIKDGGNTYVFFTTNLDNEKIVICCSKAN